MTTTNLLTLLLYTFGLSLGQCLFKLAADSARLSTTKSFWPALLSTGQFYASIMLYAFLTLVWIWILARVSLSRAYPFVALAFVFTPALAVVFFGEKIDLWYALGLGLIIAGLVLIVVKANQA